MSAVVKSTVAHTPGPWVVVIEETGMAKINGGDSTKQAGEPFQVGWVIVEERNKIARAVDIANAHLIAAAPELLAATKALLVACCEHSGKTKEAAVKQARAAILKAEGPG